MSHVYINFREQSETQQALSEWTFNSSRRKCTTSSMHLEQNDFDQKKVLRFCSKTKNPLFLKDDAKFSTKFRTLRKVLSKNRKLKYVCRYCLLDILF